LDDKDAVKRLPPHGTRWLTLRCGWRYERAAAALRAERKQPTDEVLSCIWLGNPKTVDQKICESKI